MLEVCRDRVPQRIERALRAISDRLAETRLASERLGRESDDLQRALNHLGILRQHLASETGRVLWE
jgi:hypothetical protein